MNQELKNNNPWLTEYYQFCVISPLWR